MRIAVRSMPRYERIYAVLFGIVLAGLSLFYGIYALIQGNCTLLGKGSPPFGALVTFYGLEARLLSSIYIGAGIWLFAGAFLGKISKLSQSRILSWVGAIALVFGLCVLVVILSAPLFQQ
jgi:hypothetical protein